MNYKKLTYICLSFIAFSGSLNAMEGKTAAKKHQLKQHFYNNIVQKDDFILEHNDNPMNKWLDSLLWGIGGTTSFLAGLGLFGYQAYNGDFTKSKTIAATGLCGASLLGFYKAFKSYFN